jgi:hypothetical protein
MSKTPFKKQLLWSAVGLSVMGLIAACSGSSSTRRLPCQGYKLKVEISG